MAGIARPPPSASSAAKPSSACWTSPPQAEEPSTTADRRLLERVGTHLSLAINNARLYEEIKHMHLGNLKALSSALNAKDYYTLGHAARVAAYTVLLGHELGWPDDFVAQAEEAAYLHDIGKIGVADRVLLKPSGLNSKEWELMRQHPIFSADIIRPLFASELRAAASGTTTSAGTGAATPTASPATTIPVVARAMCVVDSYDAMSFRRPVPAGALVSRSRSPSCSAAAAPSSTPRWSTRSCACSSASTCR